MELYHCRVVFDAFRGTFGKLSGKCACERLPVPNFFGESLDPGHLLAKFGNFAAKSVDFAAKVTDLTARFFDCRPQGRKFRAGGALADEDEAGQDPPDGQGSDQQRTRPRPGRT